MTSTTAQGFEIDADRVRMSGFFELFTSALIVIYQEDLARQIDAILEDYPSNEATKYAAENSGMMSFTPWLLPEDTWP